jgi:putative membrane-bound dehydrogenase-like protein
MKKYAPIALLSFGILALGAGCTAARGDEHLVNGRSFTLPQGFEVELLAGPPLVDRPIVADFDEQGRLYVADSSGLNDKVQMQLEEKPHRIVRLEDTDGDGRFDRQTVFADKMMFPEGTMWFDGSLYVSAPPSIWKLTDTDGDGVADRRVEWFQGKTLTGCANDLHGPYLGPDGWIYWCKGAFAQQTYARPGKPPFVTRASHIFRARPDGTGIEPVMTGGMDNPVDVVFSPSGERIFTTTFLQHPAGGRRDGLIHAVYGGVYGKVHEVIEGHKRTSPDVMPVLTHLGPAAPCGLTRYESGLFGQTYRDNLFACLFNLQKVTRHVLSPSGASFTTRDEDFLVSSDRDFHPTDVLEDADGSLVVVDTGGWYKLCCPTSQLVKPDVLGAIYRVRRRGAPKVEDPLGLKLAWGAMSPAEKASLLDDHRTAVRHRAIEMLGKSGESAVSALSESTGSARSPETRRNAVWALTRIEGDAARAAVRQALSDGDETVRQAAIHSASLWRDRAAESALRQLLTTGSAQNQRAAAEALGRIAHDDAAVALLLSELEKPIDRVLEHSLIYALIEIANPPAVRTALDGRKPLTAASRKAALIALDQMENGGLTPEDIVPLLTSSEAEIKETASWIAGHHAEWGDALAEYLGERLAAKRLAANERSELEGQLARFAKAPKIQALLVDRLSRQSAPREERLTTLRAMSQASMKEAPGEWIKVLGSVLSGGEHEVSRQAVATVRALHLPKEGLGELRDGLLELARDGEAPADLRLSALAALPGGPSEVNTETFRFLIEQLASDRPVTMRISAAEVVSKSKLDAEQLIALADVLKAAGPLEIDRLLTAYDQSTSDEVGLKLVASLKEATAISALRVESIKPRIAGYSESVQRRAEELYARLLAEQAGERSKLEDLLTSVAGGDIRRGQAVFNGSKAACSTCHAIGYLGGKVGPDLTRIGQIRTERDLLESIVFPSASFVRSYEPVAIATKDGRTISGVLRKDSADEVVLATSATEEARITRGDIEEMRAGTVSIMPAGLDKQLSNQEMADLVAFLKACK